MRPGLRVFLHLGRKAYMGQTFVHRVERNIHMRVILRFEFDSPRPVAIDGADIYDGPDPGHGFQRNRKVNAVRQSCMEQALALVAGGKKIMSAKKTEQRAENDKGAAVFSRWDQAQIESQTKAPPRRAGSGAREGRQKTCCQRRHAPAGRGTWGAAAAARPAAGEAGEGGGAFTGLSAGAFGIPSRRP